MITIHIETENKAFEFSEDFEINNILSNISPTVTKVVYCGNVAQKYPIYTRPAFLMRLSELSRME